MANNFILKHRHHSKVPKLENRRNKDPVAVATLRLSIKIVVMAILIILMFTHIFGIVRLNDVGMLPSTAPGDLIIFYRLDKKYIVGDVIVFDYKGEKRTARVVALPGDRVDIDKSGLKINGKAQYEPKIYKQTMAIKDAVVFPITLKNNEYFILGDNRDKSADSRIFGPVTDKDLYGKVFALFRRRDI